MAVSTPNTTVEGERGEAEDREPGDEDERGHDERGPDGRECVADCVLRVHPTLATCTKVLAQEVDAVVHGDTERHRGDDGVADVLPTNIPRIPNAVRIE